MKSSGFNCSYALMEGRREAVIERCDGNTGCWYRGSSAAPLAGIEHVSFSATDTGGGVYEGPVEIDGEVVTRQVIDPNGGRCNPPFTYVTPCKPSASGTIAVDTRGVPAGTTCCD